TPSTRSPEATRTPSTVKLHLASPRVRQQSFTRRCLWSCHSRIFSCSSSTLGCANVCLRKRKARQGNLCVVREDSTSSLSSRCWSLYRYLLLRHERGMS